MKRVGGAFGIWNIDIYQQKNILEKSKKMMKFKDIPIVGRGAFSVRAFLIMIHHDNSTFSTKT